MVAPTQEGFICKCKLVTCQIWYGAGKHFSDFEITMREIDGNLCVYIKQINFFIMKACNEQKTNEHCASKQIQKMGKN